MSWKGWPPQDRAKLLEMRAQGRTYKDIAASLGRTERGCRHQYRLLTMTAEQRRAYYSRQTAKNRDKAEEVKGCRVAVPSKILPIRCPDKVWDEGMRRLDAYARRTFSQELFGDPPPGYSALERRTAQGL